MKSLREDIKKDRSNNSTKSFIVLFFYRVMHNASLKGNCITIKLWSVLKEVIFNILGINAQISYKAEIGSDIRLPHSADGVIISSKAIIGSHITIYHQVTIGINEDRPLDNQRIIIHDNCYLSAGSKIISCEVGEGCKIGPNAVVYKDLPSGSLYVSTNQIIS